MDKEKDISPDEIALNINPRLDKADNQEDVISELIPGEFESPTVHKISYKDVLPQIIVGCMIHCTVIQAGVNMAYSTILEDGLKKDQSITTDQVSWIASLVTISLPLGSFIVGPMMDLFGRKKICLISCLPGIASWIMLMLSKSITVIYIARVIAGISGGLSTVGLVYISEITHPQIRPMLLCFNSIFVSFGILLTYCLRIWFTWDKMTIVFLILNICIFLMLLFIPESPYWIMYFGNKSLEERRSEVEVVLRRLNKSEKAYEQELQRINEIADNNSKSKKMEGSIIKKCLFFYKQLQCPTVYKPLILLIVLFLTQQLAGTYVVIFYALSVFENLGGHFGGGLDKYGAMVILGVIRFLMSVLTSLFSKKIGRRVLCVTSGLGMAFSMFFSAMYIYLTSSCDQNGKIREIMAQQTWVLLVIVLFYVCTSCLGFVIIPWTLIGELLPISVRGVLGGVMVSIAYIMMFGMIKGYPFMIAAMGVQGVFFFFSITSLIGASFVYIFLPETLGRSFLEIEQYFNNNKSDKNKKIELVKVLNNQ